MKKEINENIAEVVGIYIGDGYIYEKNGKYQIGFSNKYKRDRAINYIQ